MNTGKILWDFDAMASLTKSFPNCTSRTIRNALNGVRKSDLSARIRKRALDIGCQYKGVEHITIL